MTQLVTPEDARQVLNDLRELRSLTGDEHGAQRVAWTATWRKAREWFREKLSGLPVHSELDSAGNLWTTLKGASEKSVLIGSHLDSVPNGGWLDGCLGVLAGLQVLRRYSDRVPPVTIKLVDWADEEGARFGRSLFGSSASAGSLDAQTVGLLKDKHGVTLDQALRENGVDLDRISSAHEYFRKIDGAAYLELHIEQGPVLEALEKPTGVVLGTFGVERNLVRFTGQAAHSGSTPIPMRRDAFLAAAEFALDCREIARRYTTPSANVVCTCGTVKVTPGVVTAVPGVCEISLDQRALDGKTLARMLEDAKAAADKAAAANDVQVEWSSLWRIEPRLFSNRLIDFCEEAVREVTGEAPRLPSGPLHDAAEMVPFMPTVMMFAYSSRGLSHCKEEDTPEEHLLKSIQAFLLLADKVLANCPH